MMTQAQIQALATFVSRVRDDWDHAGIVAAVTKAANLASAPAVGRALCTLAENRDLRTPALLSQPGRHWHQDGEPVGPNASHNVRCHRHPLSVLPCPQCRAEDEPVPPSDDYLKAKAEALAKRPIPTEEKRLADFVKTTEVTS